MSQEHRNTHRLFYVLVTTSALAIGCDRGDAGVDLARASDKAETHHAVVEEVPTDNEITAKPSSEGDKGNGAKALQADSKTAAKAPQTDTGNAAKEPPTGDTAPAQARTQAGATPNRASAPSRTTAPRAAAFRPTGPSQPSPGLANIAGRNGGDLTDAPGCQHEPKSVAAPPAAAPAGIVAW